MSDAIAVRSLLCNYKPHTKDGGGVISFQVDELQWQQFLATQPQLWSTWANVRLNDETESTGAGS